MPDFISNEFKYNVDYHRFADFLGIDNSDRQEAKTAMDAALLYDWGVGKSGSGDFREITNQVSKLQKKLGVSYTGMTLLKTLVHWAKIDLDDRRLKGELKIERERVKQREAKVKEIKKEAKSKRTKLEKEDKLIDKELQASRREAAKYMEKYKRNIPLEKALKVKDVIPEPVSEPVKL